MPPSEIVREDALRSVKNAFTLPEVVSWLQRRTGAVQHCTKPALQILT